MPKSGKQVNAQHVYLGLQVKIHIGSTKAIQYLEISIDYWSQTFKKAKYR